MSYFSGFAQDTTSKLTVDRPLLVNVVTELNDFDNLKIKTLTLEEIIKEFKKIDSERGVQILTLNKKVSILETTVEDKDNIINLTKQKEEELNKALKKERINKILFKSTTGVGLAALAGFFLFAY
jgi:hypothetical protein